MLDYILVITCNQILGRSNQGVEPHFHFLSTYLSINMPRPHFLTSHGQMKPAEKNKDIQVM